MAAYIPRTISYKELIQVGDWKVKVYTISKTPAFNHSEYYQNVLKELPLWLEKENSFDASHENIAFLILHAGTEGVFALINWWVGTNMLNTHIHLTPHSKPDIFEKISGDGLAPCIWELEVINHERLSWTKHVLKQYPESDYEAYLSDIVSGLV